MKDKTLALAGVFQAAELVRQAANHGTWSGYAATSSLNSLFKFEAESASDIYGGRERMRLGLETLLAVLEGDNRYADALRYAVGLLQVQKKFNRSTQLQAEIGQGLESIANEGSELDQHERLSKVSDVLLWLVSQEAIELPREVHRRHIDRDGVGLWEHDLDEALKRSVFMRIEHPKPIDLGRPPPQRQKAAAADA